MSQIHKQPWWGAPKRFDDRKNERKISWLELFYDLVYVAAIGQLTHQLAAHPSWHTAGICFLLFALVFWSWVNGSQYYDLHGTESIRTRLITFWQMLGVAAVAVTIHDAFEGHHQSFSIAFSFLEIIITYLWWSVGIYDRSHRVFNIFYTVNYLIALVLLVISIFTNYPTAICLWAVALLLNLTPPLTAARTIVRELKKRGQVFSASSALLERFGLFTIIVLAESILGIVSGIAALEHKSVGIWGAFILAVLIAFLLWSIYFDMTSEQEAKKGYSYLQGLLFLHFPLLASFSVVGACMKVLLENMGVGNLPHDVMWMFCVALAVMMLSIVGLTHVMEDEEETLAYVPYVAKLLLLVSALLLVLPFFQAYLSPLTFFALVAVLLFVPVLEGVRRWVKYRY